jgi:hypothetical protein
VLRRQTCPPQKQRRQVGVPWGQGRGWRAT